MKDLTQARRPSVRRGIWQPLKRRALWSMLGITFAVIVVHGVTDILAAPDKAPARPATQAADFPGDDMRSYATRFARAYLTFRPGHPDEQEATVKPMLAPELLSDAAVRLSARGDAQAVTDAWVAGTLVLREDRARPGEEKSGRVLITVAGTLSTGRTRYLAVTVERDRRGGLTVTDYPSFVPPPPAARLSSRESEDPVTGPDADAVTALLERFFPVYLAGGTVAPEFLVPGRTLAPLGENFDDVTVVSVADGGSQPDGEHLILVVVRARDRATRAEYTLRYRVGIKQTDRWLVNSIQGDAR